VLPSVFATFVVGFIVTNCAHWAATGRVIDRPCVHAGIRPASDAIDEWAFTVQVTADPEVPCKRDR